MGEAFAPRGTGGERTRGGTRLRLVALATLAFALLVPTVAIAAFPGNDPDGSVRIDAPDDPAFDRCEPDNDGGATCTNPFDQDFERFGFAPNATQLTATYKNDGCMLALSVATLGLCGDPHTRRLIEQNLLAGRNGPGQLSGVSADRAWKYFGEDDASAPVGDPEVEVAILDTGIRWDRGELRRKVALNEDELPEPQTAPGVPCGADDCNGDGAFNVDDYASDPDVGPTDGHPEADGILDASDLIAAFSDGFDGEGTDNEDNGFVDDIAGWDFFDDDNDPYDASSYSAASNHGSGRAEEAGGDTNNGQSGTGLCPGCQVVPMRVWDTFVVDTNQFALATLYAADNDIEIVEGAVGGLLNSRFARETFEYAYSKGTLPVIVSSDLNTADHNYPTNYNQSLHIQGSVADVEGLGENPPQEFIDFFNSLPTPLPLGTNVPVQTFFRNSGTTQYGGHAHLVMPAVTGSAATGQASGSAALIKSFGNRVGIDLAPNEIKQLMTLTSEDVKMANTTGTGTPDPAQDGWDQHFGYGRLDLGSAVEAVRDGEIPPQVLIDSPDWFAPLNVTQQDSVAIAADISADRAGLVDGERYGWELQWAPGIEPCESDFQTVATGSGADALDGELGSINLGAVRTALDARVAPSSCNNTPGVVTGGSTVDPTAPAKGVGDVDPNEPAFTVRVRAVDSDGNAGEDRKVLFAYEDETLSDGWARPIGGTQNSSGRAEGGGESSHRMYDLDGDNELEIIEATSSGTLGVFEGDGTPSQSFNGGDPVRTREYFNVHGGEAGFDSVDPPNEALRIPAIGDIDGDREPEIVNSAGHHVYAWETDGSDVDGFPVAIDPANSQKADISRVNHVKRGFLASPALGDLDDDGDLEITIAGLDQYLYAWEGDGNERAGFPVYLRERDAGGAPIPCSAAFECAESINTPAIGDIDGDEVADIVISTNEFDDNPSAPGAPPSLGGLSGVLTNFLASALGGSSRVYAVDADGEFLPGWPITVDGILPDVLPFVGPGVDQVLADVDGDDTLDVIGNAATGDVIASAGDGSTVAGYDSQPASGENVDKTKNLNLFENPVVANLDGSGGLEVLKGGQTLIGIVNLGVLVGQNLPYNHILQAWNASDGTSLPAYPQAVEDYQLLSSPTVADVSDAPGNEAIVGTGLYLIRNLNSAGLEGSDWPKFTGGWNFAVPSVGDVDGDGDLEVAAQTREGFAFLWETDGAACDGGNDEWWTSRHDEWNTGAYGTDARPPGTPEDLAATRNDDGSYGLSWTAPGDEWLCGDATSYEVRVANAPIKAPSDGRKLGTADAGSPGDAETSTISAADVGDARYAAILYTDEAGNWGRLASVELAPAPGDPGTPTDPDDPDTPDDPGTPGTPTDPDNPTPPGPDNPDGPDAPNPPGPAADCETEIPGTTGNDKLRGRGLGEKIYGRGGDDDIRGRSGNDCLFGNAGSDELRGQGGDDVLRGGSEADLLKGASGDDRLRGLNGKDRIKGGGGTDDIRGGKGRDQINAGAGDDVINARGGGRDTVRCGSGRDRVKAGKRDKVARNCEQVDRGR